MNDQQNYERLERLYAALPPEGQSAMRAIYPGCFVEKLPTTLDEVYEASGMQTTMQVNIPIHAVSRAKSFCHLLNIEAALNSGAEGSYVVSLKNDDGVLTAYHQVARASDPAYRLPVHLDAKKMDYVIATFPDILKTLLS